MLDLAQAIEIILTLASQHDFSYVVTPNVDHMVRLHECNAERQELWQAYLRAELCLCDSRVLAALASASQIKVSVVPGSDLTAALIERPLNKMKIALVGGDPSQAGWLRRHWPGAQVVQHIPPMGLRNSQDARIAVAEFVEHVHADIVLLTVGSPQSEFIAHLISERGRARGVALCVGASLEFMTGAKQRAPKLLQNAGLEWAFRLLTEPRRLWHRYLIVGPRILKIWMQWRINPLS